MFQASNEINTANNITVGDSIKITDDIERKRSGVVVQIIRRGGVHMPDQYLIECGDARRLCELKSLHKTRKTH